MLANSKLTRKKVALISLLALGCTLVAVGTMGIGTPFIVAGCVCLMGGGVATIFSWPRQKVKLDPHDLV